MGSDLKRSEAAIREIAQARAEPEAKQHLAQSKDMITRTASVGIMRVDSKVGAMVEQCVKHIGPSALLGHTYTVSRSAAQSGRFQANRMADLRKQSRGEGTGSYYGKSSQCRLRLRLA